MKDFQDFADSLDRETINTLMFQASSFSNLKEEQMFMISLELLRMYHTWLHGSEDVPQNEA